MSKNLLRILQEVSNTLMFYIAVKFNKRIIEANGDLYHQKAII